ncbi:VWA domain-containing protein [bacterium]|nr:VWA domain-containing protein [bacterium]MCI0602284.1 VWA domain-containing protein [bacterium]
MVQFSNPAALWFLTLTIPIILLYLLKRRRLDKIVPSTMLWKQALEDTQAYTPFQKLRSNLLLLLQLLAVVLLTALLAQPYFPRPSKQSRQWILVIDASASMQTEDEAPNRFEAARKKLRTAMESIEAADEVMLIAVGSEASILQNFTLNHEIIRKKLSQLETEDVAGQWEQILLILKPLLKRSPKPIVMIASDFANFPLEAMQALNFDVLQVGHAIENLGFTRAVMEPLADTMQEQLLFFQLKNFSGNNKKADVEIEQNNELLNAFEFHLGPMEEAEKAFRVPVVTAAQFRIRLKPEDLFSLDNDFVLMAHPRAKIQTQLEVDNSFLKRALQVLPALEILPLAPIKISNRLQDAAGLYFLRGEVPDIHPIVQWNQAASPLRFVDAGIWRISNYQILEPPAGSQVLLETSKGVVGYLQETGGVRKVVLGFQMEDTNLALLAGFPIFVENAMEWIHAGLHPDKPTLTGHEYTQEGEIDSGKGYVNFADTRESELTPARIQTRSKPETKATVLRHDFSNWFLMALLGVIILEWWVFHRKESV